jgi:fermentation-respiration switch protein FrsA (DUF1100 family)
MAHGFSAVKEMFRLSAYAERFQKAGFVTLVFDFRFLGASDGEPRGRIVSFDQQADYRNAITWLTQQPGVDPERIGVWGTSYSGGHVLHLAAFDRRIKAVVAQVPTIDPVRQIVHRSGEDGFASLLGQLTADRARRLEDPSVSYIKVVGAPGEVAALGVPDAYEAMMRNAADAPSWVNTLTLDSLENYVEYLPTARIERISPTPLLMVLAEEDSLIPAVLIREAFERAGEPKKLIAYPCGHFDVYEKEPWFTQVVGSMVEWYTTYL